VQFGGWFHQHFEKILFVKIDASILGRDTVLFGLYFSTFRKIAIPSSFGSIILVFPLIKYTQLSCAAVLLGLLDHENENITILRNVGSCSPNETASHSRKPESSARCSSTLPHPGRITCCPSPDRRPSATKAIHIIYGNNINIISRS